MHELSRFMSLSLVEDACGCHPASVNIDVFCCQCTDWWLPIHKIQINQSIPRLVNCSTQQAKNHYCVLHLTLYSGKIHVYNCHVHSCKDGSIGLWENMLA